MRSKTARLSPLRPRTTSHPAALYALHLLCHVFSEASINKSTHVGQPVFSVLFALLSLAGDSPPASKRTKIPRKSKAVRCEAVLPELKCSQTRKRPQRILCVFSRALTQYEGISARQNRMFSCLSMANSARKRASEASALRRAAAPSNESPTKWVSFESLSKILF